MIYYIPVLIFLALGVVELLKPDRTIGSGWLILIAAFLIVFAGLRLVGPDLQEYTNYFNLAVEGDTLQKMGVEPLYIALNWMVKHYGYSIHVMFLLIATIAVPPKMVFIKKYAPYVASALMIYYSTVFVIKEMGQIRHGVAIGFALLSFGLMADKRTGLSMLMAFVALQFHYSAVCIIPAWFIVNKRFSNKSLLITLLLILPLILFDTKPFLNAIVKLIPVESVQSKGTFYLNSPLYGFAVGIDSSIVLRLAVLFAMMYYRTAMEEKLPRFNTFFNLYFLGICYYILFSSVSEFAQRTSVYFRSLEIAILPGFILLGRSIGDRVLIFLLLGLNSVFTLYKLLENPLGKEMYDGYANQLTNWIGEFMNIMY